MYSDLITDKRGGWGVGSALQACLCYTRIHNKLFNQNSLCPFAGGTSFSSHSGRISTALKQLKQNSHHGWMQDLN